MALPRPPPPPHFDATDEQKVRLYEQIHIEDPDYGTTSLRWLPLVQYYVDDLKPDSILDFGCGKSLLVEHIKCDKRINRFRYDPAIPDIASFPTSRVELVLNIDVMEHIPEMQLDDFIDCIHSLSENAFFIVNCRPAWAVLPDGTNAHCTVHPPDWWEQKLKSHFKYLEAVDRLSSKTAIFVTWKSQKPYVVRFKTLKKIWYRLISMLCLFVPVKSWRKLIRDSWR